MSNRRLIAMIRGWATAGDPSDLATLAARPPVIRALSRWIGAVVGVAIVAVLAAAFSGGNAVAIGRTGRDTVSGQAASAPVAVSVGKTVVAPEARLPVATLATIRVTPTPAPAPAPVVRSVVVPPAPGSVEAIILQVFGAHGRAAIGVARCESHLNPASVSRNGANWGLFQINVAHRARVAQMGYRWEDLLNPRINALVAKSIFDQQGWGPWACRGAAG